AVQAAWRATALDQGIELDEDDREDTWPVTKRRLGVASSVPLTIGIVTHRETYIETNDPYPLERLTCDVGPSSLLSGFSISRISTGNPAFDADFTVRANDEKLAFQLLSDHLRTSVRDVPLPLHFRYDRGLARLTWPATHLEPSHLAAALAAVLAA